MLQRQHLIRCRRSAFGANDEEQRGAARSLQHGQSVVKRFHQYSCSPSSNIIEVFDSVYSAVRETLRQSGDRARSLAPGELRRSVLVTTLPFRSVL